jgi:hypothetical protein
MCPIRDGFRDRAISLNNSKIVDKKEIGELNSMNPNQYTLTLQTKGLHSSQSSSMAHKSHTPTQQNILV